MPLTVSSVAITGASGAQNNFVNAGDNVSVTVNFTENASDRKSVV